VAQHPATSIIETAKELRNDLIVMASHGRRGLKGMLLGSQTYEVVTRSTVPVLVVR
jgi:nucleotide-binding universal stress UspA family protein